MVKRNCREPQIYFTVFRNAVSTSLNAMENHPSALKLKIPRYIFSSFPKSMVPTGRPLYKDRLYLRLILGAPEAPGLCWSHWSQSGLCCCPPSDSTLSV